MENLLAIAVGALVACGVFLILARDLVRVMLGLAIVSNAANLLIFTSGRVIRDAPPIIPSHLEAPQGAMANPLPQALILTAIVIGFSLLAFALVLTYRAFITMRTVDVDAMRLAEPPYEDQDVPSGAAGRQPRSGGLIADDSPSVESEAAQ